MEYYLLTLLKLVVGFVMVMAYMNYMGKTQISQMTSVDFIGNFILGACIGGVVYSDTIPFYQYILVLTMGLALMAALNTVAKHFDFFRKVTIGVPIAIIKDGQFVMENIEAKNSKIDIINVASILHAQGIRSFQEVRYAQIEPNGQLTVVKADEPMPSVIVMVNGNVMTSELEKIEKDEAWLDEQLQQHNIANKEHVFLAEFWEGETTFVLKGGSVRPKSALTDN